MDLLKSILGIGDNIKTFVGNAIQGAENFGGNVIKGVENFAQPIVHNVEQGASQIVPTIQRDLSQIPLPKFTLPTIGLPQINLPSFQQTGQDLTNLIRNSTNTSTPVQPLNLQGLFKPVQQVIAPYEQAAGNFLNNFKLSDYTPQMPVAPNNAPLWEKAGAYLLGLTKPQQDFSKSLSDFVVSTITQPVGQLLQAAGTRGILQGSTGQKLGDALNLVAIAPFGKLTEILPKIEPAVKLLQNKLRPEDVRLLGTFAEMVDKNPKQNMGQIGQDVQHLAENVFGSDAANWSNVKLKNVFDVVLQKIGTKPNQAGLGLAVGDIRQGMSNIAQGAQDFLKTNPEFNVPEVIAKAQEIAKADGRPVVAIVDLQDAANQLKAAVQPAVQAAAKVQPYATELTGLLDTKPVFDAGEMSAQEAASFVQKWNTAVESGAINQAKIAITDFGKIQPASVADKARGFVETIQQSPRTAQEVAQGVSGTYTPITNKETLAAAQDLVKNNFDQAVKSVLSDAPLTAQDTATAQVLIDQAQKAGHYDEAIGYVEKMAQRLTQAGQAVQAASIWNKLSPAGFLRFTQQLFDKANSERDLLTKWIGKSQIDLTPDMTKEITTRLEAIKNMTDPTAKYNATKDLLSYVTDQIPPTISSVLDEYRYNNILSSPQTHLTNGFSNLLQALITNPVTKLANGAVDFARATLTGGQRTAFVKEVPAYYRGVLGNLGTAITDALDVLKNGQLTRPDVPANAGGVALPSISELIQSTKMQRKNVLPTALTIPSRMLEASDKFFMALIQGGEKAALEAKAAAGAPVQNAAAEALKNSKYFLFRGGVDTTGAETGQGYLLQNIDKFSKAIYDLRKVPGVSWFIPFVQTPMNIIKQSIEYSPAGFATMAGAVNPQEQFAKALTGSLATSAAAWLVSNLDTTWDAPIGTKEKELFYASGRMPYSIKIGDTWVQINKLGVLATPLIIPMAIKHAFGGDNKPTDTVLQNVGQVVAYLGKYFSDQTYLTGLGDLVKAAQGDIQAQGQALVNFPKQLIPMASLQGWAARLIDNVSRNPGKDWLQNLEVGIPFLSTTVPAYQTPTGEPSIREFNKTNAVFPIFRFNKAQQPVNESLYQQYKAGQAADRLQQGLKTQIENQQTPAVQGASATATLPANVSPDVLNYAKAYKFDQFLQPNDKTGIAKYQFAEDKAATARKIFEGQGDFSKIPDPVKEQIYTAMGFTKQQVEYDSVANASGKVKSQFVIDSISQAKSHADVLSVLLEGRKQSLTGSQLVTDSILSDAKDAGYISADEYTKLKAITIDANGNRKTKAATSGVSATTKAQIKSFAGALASPPKIKSLLSAQAAASSGQSKGLPVPGFSVNTNPAGKLANTDLSTLINNSKTGAATPSAKVSATVKHFASAKTKKPSLKLSKSFYRPRAIA